MVEVLSIEDYGLDLDALNLALSEYRKFRESEEYKESFKWDILQEVHQWLSEREITEESVEEFVEKLEQENPSSGSLTHWTDIDDLKEFAKENPSKASELINQLFDEEIELKNRIGNFRDSLELGTPMFGYMLSAYDYSKYAPIRVRDFRNFLDYFVIGEDPGIGGLSVGEKYRFYIDFCNELAGFISNNSDVEATALNAEDFIHCSTNPLYGGRENYMLKYLYKFAQKMERFSENTDDLLNEIRTLPSDFLREEMEKYEDRGKISRDTQNDNSS